VLGGSDPAEVVFEVLPGETPAVLAPRLHDDGFVLSERAFLFTAIEEDLDRPTSGPASSSCGTT
jgi:hypothetical protein